MTLARTRPHFDSAVAYLELTATLLLACRAYFTDSVATMAAATEAVAELEERAAGPGHPAASVARRWRTSRAFPLARELRDGLAGVRLMVESATVATGNAAGALGLCEQSQDETSMHDIARGLTVHTTAAHTGFVALTRHLTSLDGILRDLRSEPWSVPDRMLVEQLRRKVASGDLTRANRELRRSEDLLAKVRAEISAALET